MNGPMTITVGGTTYNVCVEYESIRRSFEVLEGPNSGTSIRGRAIRDILGTNISYSMKIMADPRYPAQYDALFLKLAQVSNWSSAKNYCTVVVPFGQSTLTLNAKIESASDTYKGYHNGYKRWDEMDVTFTSIAPVYT